MEQSKTGRELLDETAGDSQLVTQPAEPVRGYKRCGSWQEEEEGRPSKRARLNLTAFPEPEKKEGEATPNLCLALLLTRAAEVPGWSCGDSYWTLYGLQHGVSTEELGQEEEQVVDKEEATDSVCDPI